MKQIALFPLRDVLVLTAALSVLLAGCSSVKTNVDKGTITARSFSFMNTGPKQAPSYADDSKQAHILVQQALMNSLSARGVTYVPTGGDVTVAYLIIVGNNVSTSSLNDYFGYTDDANSLMEKAHKQQTSSDNRAYFEAGTLIIDFIEPQTSKLLQRRTIQAEILRNLPMEKRAARVQSLVNQELSNVAINQ